MFCYCSLHFMNLSLLSSISLISFCSLCGQPAIPLIPLNFNLFLSLCFVLGPNDFQFSSYVRFDGNVIQTSEISLVLCYKTSQYLSFSIALLS